jgi:fatty acid CoA ligase FadD32
VEITHRNLAANVRQLWTAFGGGRTRYTGVNWLPLFHDMGLLATVAMPVLNGTDAVFLDPAAFLMRPARWLRLLSGRPAAYTAAPNFAYDYCLRRVASDDREGLDLSGVFLWLNGGEPVDAGTMDRFAAAFRDAGVLPQALCAAYGLAEATAFVAADRPDRPPTVTRFDRMALVSCGTPVGQEVAIVDGEIRVRGPNVSRQHSPWLRTGDLGLVHDGQLYVTGRLKDMLILAGRNHYPQEIEATVASLSRGRVVAFGLPVEGEERAVVVAERSTSAPWDEHEVRAAVWAAHNLPLHDIVPTAPGTIPRTSSGKLSRTACRQRYLAGELRAR